MIVATAQQMRELDRIAIRERGIPSTELMEHAAAAVAERCLARLAGKEKPRAAVFCGAGNNGGDGVAAARLLLEAGVETRCFLVGRRDKMTPDCREMEALLEASGGKLEDFTPDAGFAGWCLGCDLMVDALFGIGLNTELRGDAYTAVQMMNTCAVPVVAVDISSGVEADTGRILGCAVEAVETVTFTAPKAGHLLGEGGFLCGKLTVADIGIPADLTRRLDGSLHAVFPEEIRLPRRRRDSHKGNYGKVYILAGSVGYSGAPVLAARAAVRCGSGLVSVGVPSPVWPIAAGKLDEAMPHPLPASKEGMLSLEAAEEALRRMDGCGVCLIGPGLGRSNSVGSVVRHVLRSARLPVVLDADGINALAGHIDGLDVRQGSVPCSLPMIWSLSGWAATCPAGTGWRRPGPLPRNTAVCWCSRDTAPSPPFRTARHTSTPPATPAWPRGAAATCSAGSSSPCSVRASRPARRFPWRSVSTAWRGTCAPKRWGSTA